MCDHAYSRDAEVLDLLLRVDARLRRDPAEARREIVLGDRRVARRQEHGVVGRKREKPFKVSGDGAAAPLFHQMFDLLLVGCRLRTGSQNRAWVSGMSFA
jgi:hypothetical protein